MTLGCFFKKDMIPPALGIGAPPRAFCSEGTERKNEAISGSADSPAPGDALAAAGKRPYLRFFSWSSINFCQSF